MAGIKISGLPAVTSSAGSDVFPVVQGGVTKKETLDQSMTRIVTVVNPNGTGAQSGTYDAATGMALLGDYVGPDATGSFGKIAISNDRNKNEAAFFGSYRVAGGGGQAWLAMGLRNSGTDNVLGLMDPDGDIAFASSLYGSGFVLSNDPITTLKTGIPVACFISLIGTFAQNTNVKIYDPGQANTTLPQLLSNDLGIPCVTSAGLLTIRDIESQDASVIVTNGGGVASNIDLAITKKLITTYSVSSISQSIVTGRGYAATNGSLVTYSLPANANPGDSFDIADAGTGRLRITQGTGQFIQFGNAVTTTGVGGSLQSTAKGDTVTIKCIVTNTQFHVISSIGTWTIV